jgi:hypothetical protein
LEEISVPFYQRGDVRMKNFPPRLQRYLNLFTALKSARFAAAGEKLLRPSVEEMTC